MGRMFSEHLASHANALGVSLAEDAWRRLEVLALDGERPDHLGEMPRDRLCRMAVVGPGELEAPVREHPALLARGGGALVDRIVDRPAERVERVDRVPLALRQEQERVVEIGPAAAGQYG